MDHHFDIAPLLDAKQVKRLLGVSLSMVFKLAGQGRLPHIRIPCIGKGTEKPRTLVRFKREDVYQFIEDHYGRHSTAQRKHETA